MMAPIRGTSRVLDEASNAENGKSGISGSNTVFEEFGADYELGGSGFAAACSLVLGASWDHMSLVPWLAVDLPPMVPTLRQWPGMEAMRDPERYMPGC